MLNQAGAKTVLCQFTGFACQKKAFRRQLCREHFCAFVRAKLKNTLQTLYKAPDNAFGMLDPSGLGHITLDAVLSSHLVPRTGLKPEELTAFFELKNIFKNGEGAINFAQFRELFFP